MVIGESEVVELDSLDLRSSNPPQYIPAWVLALASRGLESSLNREGPRNPPENGTSLQSVGPRPRQSMGSPFDLTSLPISFAVDAYVGVPLSTALVSHWSGLRNITHPLAAPAVSS